MPRAITPGKPSPDANASDPPASGRVTWLLVLPHSPLGESRPEGPVRGEPSPTLRVGFAEEPWANAQRLICSVVELARVWWTA